MSPLQRSLTRLCLSGMGAAALFASCATDDGRQLPPPRTDQFESILTTSTTTTVAGAIESSQETSSGEQEAEAEAGDVASSEADANAGAEGAVAGGPVDVDLTTQAAPAAAPFTLAVPWGADGPIPIRHSCQGVDERDVPPSVQWAGVPVDTVELAVVMTDITAGGYIHWIVTGVSPTSEGLIEGQPSVDEIIATNSAGSATYLGPCPPAGETHTYLIEVFALIQQFEPTGTSADDTVAALRRITLQAAEQTGTFTAA